MSQPAARIIVLGGGMCGLTAGLLLERDGHEVAVPESVEQAWEQWPREALPAAGTQARGRADQGIIAMGGFAGRYRRIASDRRPPFPGPVRKGLLRLLG